MMAALSEAGMEGASIGPESVVTAPRGLENCIDSAIVDTLVQITTPDEALITPKEASEDYMLPKCEMPPQSELQPIETFVFNAIQSQDQKSPDAAHIKGYRGIIDALRKPNDPRMLRLVLISLRTAGHGSVLHQLTSSKSQAYVELIHWIFRFDATAPIRGLQQGLDESRLAKVSNVYQDGSMLDAHLHLILALVSARTVNLTPALTAVWKMITDNIFLDKSLTHRLHAMLCTMMRLVPKARTDLYPIIASRFPFWKKDKDVLKWYCIQAFQVVHYLPTIRKHLLELVIDKCLEIDVNIKIKDNGEVSVHEEQKEDDNTDRQVEKPPEDDMKVEEVDVLSDKLDSLLALLFRTLGQISIDGQHTRELYYEVLPVFESTILTTHKSKFVQYCMFLLCGLESQVVAPDIESDETESADQEYPILHREFAAKLLETIMDPYRATLTRQSGACYLASFVSRATFVGPETICESVSALLRWAEAYIETLTKNSIRAADAREQSELHSLFYTVCQAAFYIMCFRGHDAIIFYKEVVAGYSTTEVSSSDEEVALPDLSHMNLSASRWTSICSHELQPLRFCLESVRSEFLHVAHAFELVDDNVLDKLVVDAKRLSTGRVNKKAASTIKTAATLEKQRQTGGVGGLGRGSNPLKSFFPFDPLLLRRSHALIDPFFKHWQGPVEEEDVLVIDDGPDNDDQIFEMDEEDNPVEESEDENDGPVVISDQDTKDDDSDSDSDGDTLRTPDTTEKKELQRKAWTEAMKRPRSQSMENGSW